MLSLSVNGQTTFFYNYEAPIGNEPKKTVILPGGDLMTGGRTSSFGAGAADILLVKTDTAGNLHWSKTIGTAGDEGISSMIVTSTNQIAALSDFGGQYHSFFLFDTAGNTLVQRTFFMDALPYNQTGNIVELASGNFLICTNTGDGVALVNLSSSGATNWTQYHALTISPAPYMSYVNATELSNGNIAIIFNISFGSLPHSEIVLLITDNLGNYLSSKRYSSTVDLASLRIYTSLVTGDLYVGATGNSSRFFLMKLDDSGNIRWSKSYQTTFMPYANTYDMVFNPFLDEFAVLGGPGSGGFEVVRFDSSANFLWSQSGIDFNQAPVSILGDQSGAIIVTGFSPSPTTSYLNQFICRYLPDGTRCNSPANTLVNPESYTATAASASFTTNPPFTLTDSIVTFITQTQVLDRVVSCATQVGIDPVENDDLFTMNSNIIFNELLINTSTVFNSTDEIRIQDISGRIVAKFYPQAGTAEFSMNLSSLSNGHYILSFRRDGRVVSKRFVVSR